MNTPVSIYSEMTPNPSTMKFVADRYLIDSNSSVDFRSLSQSKGFSPLAEALFAFPFVDGVFVAANFVTVTKTDNVPWDFITMELRNFITTWINDGKDILIAMPDKSSETAFLSQHSDKPEQIFHFEPSELDDSIADILDEYVRPAVEGDGGAIDYLGFNNGTVSVLLKGACSGCPSSTATLKGGIEQLLKQHFTQVKEVVAINDPY